jgi:ABC-type lipoprotein release transport system permease subunit
MGAEVYRIKGLLRTGSNDIDRAMVLMTMADAQKLFAMPGRFTEWVIRSDNFRRAGNHASDLRNATADLDVEVLTWQELMPELQQTRAFDDAGNNIFYLFLILLVGFEIFNTATMTVLERVREFGVLQSIGLRPRQVSLLVFMELAIKIVIGVGVGMAILISLALAFPDVTIPLSEDLREMYASFGFTVEGFGFSTRPVVFIQPLVSVLVVSFLAILYPIWKVRQYSPVDAMRHV